MGKVQLQEAVAGDIVALAGAGDAAGIADTLAAPGVAAGLDPGRIDPPTLRRGSCLCSALRYGLELVLVLVLGLGAVCMGQHLSLPSPKSCPPTG
jgi:hypothetical protein